MADSETCQSALVAFPSRSGLARNLADMIAKKLLAAIAARGRASLAVSGGSTPAPLYALLREVNLDWSKVTVVLVDERWVAPGQDGSNETFVSTSLLQGKAEQAKFVGLWSDTPFPRDAALIATHKIKEASLAPFDAVVLGMGEDGHTASWFPHCAGLGDALGRKLIVTHIRAQESAIAGPHLDRLTLSLGALQSADLIVLMLAGDAKQAAFESACSDGPVEDMPVRAILKARPNLFAAWAP